ncbi:MAG: hypothetical protein HYU29_07990 [Chloroflexi bacterium]|nr:hypothetical protein [Chloroflexota bacterium]
MQAFLCKHHWVIDTPNGPLSQGVCKLCGLENTFRNSLPDMGWDREHAERFLDRLRLLKSISEAEKAI